MHLRRGPWLSRLPNGSTLTQELEVAPIGEVRLARIGLRLEAAGKARCIKFRRLNFITPAVGVK